MIGTRGMSMTERIFVKVAFEPNCGCWLWLGKLQHKGYPMIGAYGKWVSAHRFSYEQFVGKIPPGLEIDHKCSVRSCVNPQHLEAVTHLENIRRSPNMGKAKRRLTHCPHGHAYSGDNVKFCPKGYRLCIICSRVWKERSNAKRRIERAQARLCK